MCSGTLRSLEAEEEDRGTEGQELDVGTGGRFRDGTLDCLGAWCGWPVLGTVARPPTPSTMASRGGGLRVHPTGEWAQ